MSSSSRGQHDQQLQLQLQPPSQLQIQQPQLLPIPKSPIRGDDSPHSALSLSLSLARKDMDQLRHHQHQQQNQQRQLQQLQQQQQQQRQPSRQHQHSASRNSNGPQPNGAQDPEPRKVLSAGCKIVKMVGEGAANAVFEFTLPSGGHLHHQDTRLLLRVAKIFEEDDRPRFDYEEQYQYYLKQIKPILGSYVLHQELVTLESGIIDAINDFLRSINNTRTAKFRDSYVEASKLGFLVEDMRPEDPAQSLLVEFKPKWLSQSPSAPSHAIRCRQCAKELHSYVTEPGLKRPVPTQAKPCPLTLNSDGYQAAKDSSRRLVPHLDDLSDDLSSTLDVLRDEDAFECLRQAQEDNDEVGPLGAEPDDTRFALAMTLRDCTCFAVMSTRAGVGRDARRPLKVRFGDFDMKIPKFRLDYWRRVEEQLIEGGFYTASWLYCGQSFYAPPTNCVLESLPETLNFRRRDRPEIIHLEDPKSMARGDGVSLFLDMETKLGRSPVVHSVETDADTLEKCLVAYKRDKPTLKRPRPKQESESWLSASCRQF
jgi:inositol-pentakisphosphate 2-kinase